MPFGFKIIVILMLIAIFYALGSGLYYLMRDGGRSPRMVKALAIRLGISIILFAILIIAFFFGWISPHPI